MKYVLNVAILGLSILFVVVASLKIKYPGINYDELLFVNAVRGFASDDIYIKLRLGGIPFMLTAYIGALKSYLYFPIFSIFGYSVETIRIPMILLMGIGIFIFHKAILKLSNNQFIAFFCAFFLAIDPSIIILTRADQGPIVIELFLKILSIFLLGKFIDSGKIGFIWGIAIVFFLGTFNKLNFIWSVNAILFGTIIYWKDFWQYFKNYSVQQRIHFLTALILTYLPSLSFFLWAKEHFGLSVKNPGVTFWLYGFPAHERLWYLIKGMLDFSLPLSFGLSIPNGSFAQYGTPIFVIITSTTAFLILINRKNINKIEKLWLFAMLSFIAISVQLYYTWRAISVWHAINIYPFIIILSVVSLLIIHDRLLILQLMSKILVTFLLLYFINIRLFIYRRYFINLEKPVSSVHWSNKIYDLTTFVDNTNKNVYLIEWGTLTQLRSFAKKPKKIFEPLELRQRAECMEFPIDDYKPKLFYEKYLKNPTNNLFISLGDVYKYQSLRQTEFLKLIKSKNLKLKTEKVFNEGENISYTVYSIQPNLND